MAGCAVPGSSSLSHAPPQKPAPRDKGQCGGQLDFGGEDVGVKRALSGLEATRTWGCDMGLEWGVRVGLAWDGERKHQAPHDETGRAGCGHGGHSTCGLGSRRSQEKPRAAAYPVRSPQNPRLSTKVYPHLNSDLPHLVGCMSAPQDSEGLEVAPGFFLGLQSYAPHSLDA